MENNQPLVSVIVPIYNAEKYLRECIDSIVEQTYKNLEILLINDGSIDASGRICDAYANKDVRIKVIHKKNGGVSSARNLGIETASGEFIMFVDSDDKLVFECVELLLDAITKRNFDIACGGVVDSNNESYFEGDSCEWIEKESIMQSLKDHPYTFAVWSKLYRKSVLEHTRFSPDIKINEDTLFLFEILCKQPKVVNLKDRVYLYRQNIDSASNAKYSEKYEDVLIVSNRKYQIIKNQYPELLYLAENMMLKARMNLLRVLCTRTHGEKRELELTLIKYVRQNHKSYISMNRTDDQWLKFIRYNLYYLYKLAYRIKKAIK